VIREKRFIPDREIEKKAYAMLSGFESQYGKVSKPPVPIDRIIECHLDLWIDWDVIEDTDEEKILGLLNPDTKKICLNERHRDHFEDYIGTEAFTKAHEVGHWDLHVAKEGDAVQLQLLPKTSGQPYLCRQQKYDQREIQAERYAAYLLMPYHLVMETINGVEITHWSVLYFLRDLFGVSITAFTNRLKGLRLIYITEDKKIFRSEQEALGTESLL
jgi:Zn-dependent peptidase ImmA (M78 family)